MWGFVTYVLKQEVTYFFLTTGSPLQFYVDAINSGHVNAYGAGLSHGMVNKPAVFTIITKDAGEGKTLNLTASHACQQVRQGGTIELCIFSSLLRRSVFGSGGPLEGRDQL